MLSIVPTGIKRGAQSRYRQSNIIAIGSSHLASCEFTWWRVIENCDT